MIHSFPCADILKKRANYLHGKLTTTIRKWNANSKELPAKMHRICDLIADELKTMNWRILREDRTQTTNGDSRYTDIVAINKKEVNLDIFSPER